MTEPLRPLSIGELLDRTFSLYRHNFVLLVGVAVVGPLALLVAQLALALAGFGGRNAANAVENPVSAGATAVVGLIFYLIGQAISSAATTRAVAAVYLGRPITIGESFASIKERIPRVIGVMVATTVVGGGGFALLVGLGVGAFAASLAGVRASGRPLAIVAGTVGAAVLVACVIAGIAFALRYALSVQACVVEDLGVRASLARSKVLTKNARRRLVTVMIVCSAVVYVLGMAFGFVAILVPVAANGLGREIVVRIFGCMAGALGAPLITAAIALLYYDERVRKEGFDLQLLMESLDGAAPANPAEAMPTLG
jgi:MFS family permease